MESDTVLTEMLAESQAWIDQWLPEMLTESQAWIDQWLPELLDGGATIAWGDCPPRAGRKP